MKVNYVLTSAFVLGGVFAVAGCASPDVGGNRDGVPAPMVEPVPGMGVENPAPAPLAPQVTPETPVGANVPLEPVATIPPFAHPAVAPMNYTVKKGDSLWLIAHAHGVSVGELLAQNVSLSKKSVLQVGQKITIPAGGAYIPPEKRPYVKPMPAKKIVKTTTVKSTKITSAPKGAVASGGTYTVVSGDFPEKIAKKNGVKTQALLDANQLTVKSVLQIGQKLIIPGKAAVTSPAPELTTTNPVPPVNTGSTPAGNGTEVAASPVSSPVPPPVSPISADPGRTIQANAGETLRSISVDFFLSLDELKRLNPGIAEDQSLTEGTVIKIPQA